MRKHIVIGALAAGAALVPAAASDARACGGCFIRPTTQSGTVVTDHRMIFSVSTTQTTLYDQIRYSGSPSDFAWVLPIRSQVTLGVSSDLLFSTLEQLTQTDILAPPYPCPQMTLAPSFGGGGSGGGGFAGAAADAGVTVIAMQVVGPYQTVQLHPNSTADTAALTAWLANNNYAVPASIDSVIAAYVMEGFDFLAVKLVPGAGVQSMRPLAITTPGAGVTLPLRMVAAGTGSTVGITLWVVGQGRYEPQNFPSFIVAPSSIVWNWSTSGSNYATLRAQKEAQLGNAAWQIESSLDFSPYAVESPVLQDPTASAYVPVPGPDGGAGLTALEARSKDLNALFPVAGTSVRITRMRADLSQAALANDLLLQASSDQTTLSNVYQTTLSINANCSGGSGGPLTSSGGFGGVSPGAVADGGTGPSGSGGGPTGAATTTAGGGNTASGCSASPARPAGAGFFAVLGALAGALLWRARSRKERRAPRRV